MYAISDGVMMKLIKQKVHHNILALHTHDATQTHISNSRMTAPLWLRVRDLVE
jgi:hypothetical protein